MTPAEINERLALRLGWRRCEDNPDFWIPPGEQPDQHYYHTDSPPDALTGDGMLALLAEMRGQRFSVRYRFAEALKKAVPTDTPGQFIDWPWALMHVTPEQIVLAALQALGEEPEP